jgi:hypothetical protein
MRVVVVSALSILLMTAAAHADCAAEFADTNKVKVAAGPYRFKFINQTVIELDGKKYPGKTTTLTYEFAPPAAIHLNEPSLLGDTESIYIGTEGWTKEDGAWKSIPAPDVKDLIKDGLYGSYFNANGHTDLVCHGETVLNGRKVRSYSYTLPLADVVPHPLATTVYFSAENGLPQGGTIDNAVLKSSTHTDIVVEFDPSIRIKRPQ